MTPEMMFAQALSKNEETEQEKIASVVQQMSVDELADFLRADVEHVTRRREWREAPSPELLGHEKTASTAAARLVVKKLGDLGIKSSTRTAKGARFSRAAQDAGVLKDLTGKDATLLRMGRGTERGVTSVAPNGISPGIRSPTFSGVDPLKAREQKNIDAKSLIKRFFPNNPKVESLAAQKVLRETPIKHASADLYALADEWGRGLAHEHMEKVAFNVGGFQRGVGQLLHSTATAKPLTRIVGGTALGAATGAATAGDGNRLKGALVGGGVGAAAGHFAPSMISRAGAMNNGVGKYIQRGIGSYGRKAGNASAVNMAGGLKHQMLGNKAADKVLKAGGSAKKAEKARKAAMTPAAPKMEDFKGMNLAAPDAAGNGGFQIGPTGPASPLASRQAPKIKAAPAAPPAAPAGPVVET